MNNDLLKPTGETYKIKCHIICNTLNDENEEMIVAVNSIYAIAWRSLKKIQDFNGVWTRDLAITDAMLYQLSYEATDGVSRSIVGSYVPVKEMSVNDIWNHIWTAEMKWKWRNDRRSERNFRSSYMIYFIYH